MEAGSANLRAKELQNRVYGLERQQTQDREILVERDGEVRGNVRAWYNVWGLIGSGGEDSGENSATTAGVLSVVRERLDLDQGEDINDDKDIQDETGGKEEGIVGNFEGES